VRDKLSYRKIIHPQLEIQNNINKKKKKKNHKQQRQAHTKAREIHVNHALDAFEPQPSRADRW
jgi:hypothetical protein